VLAHTFLYKPSTKRWAVTIHPPLRLVGEPKKIKNEKTEGRKKDTRNSGKLAIRPGHPFRQIKIKLCMVGRLRCVVIHVKCDPNRLRGYGAVGVENGHFPLFLPVAYTTACTTVTAVRTQNSNVFNNLWGQLFIYHTTEFAKIKMWYCSAKYRHYVNTVQCNITVFAVLLVWYMYNRPYTSL